MRIIMRNAEPKPGHEFEYYLALRHRFIAGKWVLRVRHSWSLSAHRRADRLWHDAMDRFAEHAQDRVIDTALTRAPPRNGKNVMAEHTEISWADATFNPWIGCTKVSVGPQGACENCYAERDNKRRGWVPGWGSGVPRRRTKTWGNPVAWDRKAAETGYRPRVFCASLADVFDNEVPDEWRTDLWQLLRDTPNLRWMLLTKRIGNAPKMLPSDWPFPHVGLMATLATQAEWDRDYPKLAAVPAAWHGVSAEPLLGGINIGDAKPDWIITGGESGAGHRFTDPDWVRSLRDQCARNGVAFHFKQWGGTRPKKNGCILDGREHKDFPAALAA